MEHPTQPVSLTNLNAPTYCLLPDLPVGGRLSSFLSEWREVTSDKWLLDIVQNGLKLNLFCPTLPSFSHIVKTSFPLAADKKAWFALNAFKPEIAKLQADDYLEQVSRQALEDPTRLSVRKTPAAVAHRYRMASLGPLFGRPSANVLLPD